MSKEILGYHSYKGFIPFKECEVTGDFKLFGGVNNLKIGYNLCLLNLKCVVELASKNPIEEGFTTIVFPSEALPKEETIIIGRLRYVEIGTNDEKEIPIELTISTDGKIKIDVITLVTVLQYIDPPVLEIKNAGWEIAVE